MSEDKYRRLFDDPDGEPQDDSQQSSWEDQPLESEDFCSQDSDESRQRRNRYTTVILIASICAAIMILVGGVIALTRNGASPKVGSMSASTEKRDENLSSIPIAVLANSVGLIEIPEEREILWGLLNIKSTRSGSGFLITDGEIVFTNEHVVHGYNHVNVRFPGRPPIAADVMAKDAEADIAVLRLAEACRLPPLPYRQNEVQLGEQVYVLGYPFGSELGQEVSVNKGIVSSIRTSQNWYQIDAPINPGNSGGPCLDAKGRVIGVVTAKIKAGESIGFVRPIHIALDLAKQQTASFQ